MKYMPSLAADVIGERPELTPATSSGIDCEYISLVPETVRPIALPRGYQPAAFLRSITYEMGEGRYLLTSKPITGLLAFGSDDGNP